jgi:hypothetical protein
VAEITKIKKYSRIRKMSERDLLVKEIENVRFLMKLAYFKLSSASENELVESAVLELRSLEVKHGYLLNKLKEVEK